MLYHEKHSEGVTESEIRWPKYIQYSTFWDRHCVGTLYRQGAEISRNQSLICLTPFEELLRGQVILAKCLGYYQSIHD